MDILTRKIAEAYKAKRDKDVLHGIGELKQLPGDFPIPLLFVEATTAYRVKDYWRALTALRGFLKSSDRNAAQYPAAVALYGDYEHKALSVLQRPSMAGKRDEDVAILLDPLMRSISANTNNANPNCQSTVTKEYSFQACVLRLVKRMDVSCWGELRRTEQSREKVDFQGAHASAKVSGDKTLGIEVEVRVTGYEVEYEFWHHTQTGSYKNPKPPTSKLTAYFIGDSAPANAGQLLAAVDFFTSRCK